VSKGFSRLTANVFNPDDLKVRVKVPGARRTLGYFRDRKFAVVGVISKLQVYGFTRNNYKKNFPASTSALPPASLFKASIESRRFCASG
jgi:hypothetical protein